MHDICYATRSPGHKSILLLNLKDARWWARHNRWQFFLTSLLIMRKWMLQLNGSHAVWCIDLITLNRIQSLTFWYWIKECTWYWTVIPRRRHFAVVLASLCLLDKILSKLPVITLRRTNPPWIQTPEISKIELYLQSKVFQSLYFPKCSASNIDHFRFLFSECKRFVTRRRRRRKECMFYIPFFFQNAECMQTEKSVITCIPAMSLNTCKLFSSNGYGVIGNWHLSKEKLTV